MPHLTGERDALDRLRRLTRAGLDVAGFLNEVNRVVGRIVPNGTETIDTPFWYTLDPESHLVTSIYGQGCDVETGDFMRWDLLGDDVMKTADVLANPRGVQTLHEVTDGHPERSQIYADVMAPHGMAQEMLVALRSASGTSWGTARLNRSPGEPMFSEGEVRFMAAAAPIIADGVRRGLLIGEATEPDQPAAPGMAVLNAQGTVESVSPGTDEWFARMPRDDGRLGGVPTSVIAAAAAAMEGSDRAGGVSSLTVQTTDGRWAIVDAAQLHGHVTVIIQHAHPERLAPLLMSVYGLTGREQEITQLVLRGGSTADLAARLGVSPHTVQQHLKSIFDKTGVSSRGELVARMYFDCYDSRARDNRERIREGRVIRGGPKTAG